MSDPHTPLQRALGSAYTVERELGGGGMSTVLVARDNALGRLVVVKVLSPELAAAVSVERFRREITLVAGLNHPHIVGIISAGEADGLPYFVMPFVEGESLRARLKRGPLSVPDAVRVLRDVARALAFAHERGVVHRDIKPDNVLISGGSAMVADFGVAKALSSAREGSATGSTGTLTLVGTSLGTPAYMAPEQATGDPSSDHRADIYAFGIMAFELLTGLPPFHGRSVQALFAAHLTERPRPIAEIRPDVPAALADVVARCLEKNPADRPQTASALVGLLEDPAVVSGAFAIPTPSALPVARTRPRWLMPAVAAGSAAVIAAAVATFSLGRSRAVAPPAATAPPAASPAVAAASIAVLPFVHIGSDSAGSYLAEGMTEEITNALHSIRGLRVSSRTAASTIQRRLASDEQMSRALGVATLLEGTIQREGKQLRVTARLVNVDDGFTIWSDEFESASNDAFAVQDRITKSIVRALGEHFGIDTVAPKATSAPPNPAAYTAYVRGTHLLQQRGEPALRAALRFLHEAVRKDSTFAPAYSGIADAYALLPLYGSTPMDSVWPLGLAAANRAIELDSGRAEGWSSRGNLMSSAWRWAEAEADLRRAIAHDPQYASAHQWLGEMLLLDGRAPEAVAELQRASQLDPVSPVIAGSYSLALGIAGKTAESITRAHDAADLDPALYLTSFMLGTVQLYAGHPDSAISPLEKSTALSGNAVEVRGMLGYAYARAGRRGRALDLLHGIDSTKANGSGSLSIARIHLALGDTTQALDWMERAAAQHAPFFSSESLASPIFDPLRASPRFAALVKRVGLDVGRLTAARR